ncbi:MAG: IS1380 family transposase [Candidatus Limimorpha sp.]
MTKVAIKNENITPFGGIYHIMDVFYRLGLDKLTESVLGMRGSSGKAFGYGSVFASLFFSYLCGGECLEDTNTLVGHFRQRPGTVLPGADTAGRGLKEFSEKDIVYKSEDSGQSYRFNTAERLNTLLLRMIRKTGLIKPGSHVDMDFDHQFIPAHKFDAKYSYKQDFGYFPGWASIGGIILGGENRDGNTNVKFRQEDTLRRIMDRVKSELGVVTERFRADCGSFSKEIVRTVEQRCNTLYIRASNCGSRYEEFRRLDGWKTVEIGYEKCEVASVSMDDFIEGKSYRLAVQRSPLRDKDGNVQTDLFGPTYTYRCILANDCDSTEKDIIIFYNARGESEKNFDIQNNDFGWAHLPFSFPGENMAFMMVTAMLKNFHLYLIRRISEKVKPLKKTSRLKSFILHFVSVPAKWVRTGRRNVLNLYTHKSYYSEVFLE